MADTHEMIVETGHQDASHAQGGFLSPDMNMVLLTWVTFFLLLAILYKFAWKPILNILDQREQAIRKSIEDVDRIKAEMDNLDAKCKQIIAETEKKASGIIDQSRKAAKEAANTIENKAKEEAKITLENAVRDIQEETQKAQTQLRKESTRIAIALASKLIEANMSADKNKSLIDRFIKNI